MTYWVWISLPYATFGVRVRDHIVCDAAPIGRWMIGKSEREVTSWVTNRGGVWLPLLGGM